MADTPPRFDGAAVGTCLFGTVLLVAAAYQHLVLEPATVGDRSVPTLAFLLDGGLAVGVLVVGVALTRSERDRQSRRTVAAFGVGTGLAFAFAMALTMWIRAAEGRTVEEPTFVLLTAVGTGFLTGALVGSYRANSREFARSAARGRDTLAFVNGMLRHDIRNDAAIIAGYAEEFDGQEAATIVRERAQRVVERTELARAVAETVAGDADPDSRPLSPIVDDAVTSAATAYASATVMNELPDDLAAPVNEAFKPALDNLIENAIEHHDGDATVRVTGERDGDRVRLRVVDDGPGIPPAVRDDMFDHDVGTAEGLHVVDTIVDGLGGDIDVRDRDPRGTAVVVSLPAGSAAADAGAETVTDEPADSDDDALDGFGDI